MLYFITKKVKAIKPYLTAFIITYLFCSLSVVFIKLDFSYLLATNWTESYREFFVCFLVINIAIIWLIEEIKKQG